VSQWLLVGVKACAAVSLGEAPTIYSVAFWVPGDKPLDIHQERVALLVEDTQWSNRKQEVLTTITKNLTGVMPVRSLVSIGGLWMRY